MGIAPYDKYKKEQSSHAHGLSNSSPDCLNSPTANRPFRTHPIVKQKGHQKAVLNKTVIMFLVKRHSIFYAVSLFCLSDDIGSMPTKS